MMAEKTSPLCRNVNLLNKIAGFWSPPVFFHVQNVNAVLYLVLLSSNKEWQILSFRVIDKSMKNFKAFFRWLYVGK